MKKRHVLFIGGHSIVAEEVGNTLVSSTTSLEFKHISNSTDAFMEVLNKSSEIAMLIFNIAEEESFSCKLLSQLNVLNLHTSPIIIIGNTSTLATINSTNYKPAHKPFTYTFMKTTFSQMDLVQSDTHSNPLSEKICACANYFLEQNSHD